MKRLFAILMAAMMFLCTACGQKPQETAKAAMKAVLLEISNQHYLVEPTEDSDIRQSAKRIHVPIKNLSPSKEPQVGDLLEIVYKDEVLLTDPAILTEVYSISILEEGPSLSDLKDMDASALKKALRPYLDAYNLVIDESFGTVVGNGSFMRCYESEEAALKSNLAAVKAMIPSGNAVPADMVADPSAAACMPVQNYTSIAELEQAFAPWLDTDAPFFTDAVAANFMEFEDNLYLVRGGRGYGAVCIDPESAAAWDTAGENVTIAVDSYLFDQKEDVSTLLTFGQKDGRLLLVAVGQSSQPETEQLLVGFFDYVLHNDAKIGAPTMTDPRLGTAEELTQVQELLQGLSAGSLFLVEAGLLPGETEAPLSLLANADERDMLLEALKTLPLEALDYMMNPDTGGAVWLKMETESGTLNMNHPGGILFVEMPGEKESWIFGLEEGSALWEAVTGPLTEYDRAAGEPLPLYDDAPNPTGQFFQEFDPATANR